MKNQPLHTLVVVVWVTACARGLSPGTPAPPTDWTAPPPRPLERTDAFYIISIPGESSSQARAVVCSDDATCDGAMPPNPPFIGRRFDADNWVVINVHQGDSWPAVVSDGAIANVTIARACADGGPALARVVVYRVAKSVTKALVSLPTQGCQ